MKTERRITREAARAMLDQITSAVPSGAMQARVQLAGADLLMERVSDTQVKHTRGAAEGSIMAAIITVQAARNPTGPVLMPPGASTTNSQASALAASSAIALRRPAESWPSIGTRIPLTSWVQLAGRYLKLQWPRLELQLHRLAMRFGLHHHSAVPQLARL
jgi:hypothetical protein